MNQDGSEKKSGLKSSSSEVNEKRKPAEKMSSKIAEIDDEPEKSPSEMKKIKWQPENWLEQLNRIKTMRSQWDAPVDTMGCDSNFDANSPPNVTFPNSNFTKNHINNLSKYTLDSTA